MRVSRVTAHAFGHLTEATLELADGLTVVYGPNESGKSTWHAALLAALCGRWPNPRAKGEPGIERRRPWTGQSWECGAQIVLADGRRVELRQDLEARLGTAIDLDLGRPVPELLASKGGLPDAAHFLGLDRTAFVATACVRQSHLRLAADEANGVRAYVESAATTGSADQTAAEAIGRLDAFRRDQVGGERAHTRPLALAAQHLAGTQESLRVARERHEELARLEAHAHDLRARAGLAAAQLARHEAVQAHAQARQLRAQADRAQRLAARVAAADQPAAVVSPLPAPEVVAPTPARRAGRRRAALLLVAAGVLLLAAVAALVAEQPPVAAVLAVAFLVTGALGFLHFGRSTAGEPVLPPPAAPSPTAPAHALSQVPEQWVLEALLEEGSPAELAQRADLAQRRAEELSRGASTLDAAQTADPVDEAALDGLRQGQREAHEAALLAEQELTLLRREQTAVAGAEEEVEVARAELARLRGLDDVLGRTRQFLEQAQEKVHRQIAPPLAAAVSLGLRTVTAGRHTGVLVDPQSLEVKLRGRGEWRSVGEFSVGTVEQVYLLLRVALAERMVKEGESCPLLLDDVTVHADADRTARILDVLLAVAQRHQVVLFTQQEQVRQWALTHLDDPRHALRELSTLAPA